jgi:hypothetical protein
LWPIYIARPVGIPDADLTPSERELVQHAANGTWCDLSERDEDDRRIRAALIYELCVEGTRKVHARGVCLKGARILESLGFESATLSVPLRLTDCTIGQPDDSDVNAVNLEQVSCPWISLDDCQVHGAVSATQVRVTHTLSLQRTSVDGAVDLSGAHITGQLDMSGAQLFGSDQNGNALVADNMKVGGAVFLSDGFTAAGAVSLLGAEIIGQLDMSGAQLTGHQLDRFALVANRMKVGGDVFMRDGFTASRAVSLFGVRVDGRLDLDGAQLPLLVLQDARCSELADSDTSWPPQGLLVLGGFQFGRLADRLGWKKRLEWVRRQGFTDWSPDPYEQLAGFYTRTGDEAAARQVRIAKNDDELEHLRVMKKPGSLRYRFWRRGFGVLLGYGYRRAVAGWLLAAAVVGAGFTFWAADREEAMVPNVDADVAAQECGDAYTCFNSAMYGADVVLPIIDFGQDSAWRPVGSGWEWARWGFIAAGWVLASIFVAAFTALVRRE